MRQTLDIHFGINKWLFHFHNKQEHQTIDVKQQNGLLESAQLLKPQQSLKIHFRILFCAISLHVLAPGFIAPEP